MKHILIIDTAAFALRMMTGMFLICGSTSSPERPGSIGVRYFEAAAAKPLPGHRQIRSSGPYQRRHPGLYRKLPENPCQDMVKPSRALKWP